MHAKRLPGFEKAQTNGSSSAARARLGVGELRRIEVIVVLINNDGNANRVHRGDVAPFQIDRCAQQFVARKPFPSAARRTHLIGAGRGVIDQIARPIDHIRSDGRHTAIQIEAVKKPAALEQRLILLARRKMSIGPEVGREFEPVSEVRAHVRLHCFRSSSRIGLSTNIACLRRSSIPTTSIRPSR